VGKKDLLDLIHNGKLSREGNEEMMRVFYVCVL
jgi:hypothetical protein